MKNLPIILLIILCFIVPECKEHSKVSIITRTDTLIIKDTVYIPKPVMISKRIIDTFYIKDSIPIPISQKVYSDSNYTAYVSGFKASLDSLKIVSDKVYIETIKEIRQPKKRFTVGPQIGYGFNGAYVGVGITYNLWSF